MTNASTTQAATVHRPNILLGILPFIGIVLFLGFSWSIIFGGERPEGWQQTLVQNGVLYMIGSQGIGGAISHLFFGPAIARSIGWTWSPFQREVGFANLAFGVAGVLAANYGSQYWFAVIVASSVYLVGAGIGHIIEMRRAGNFAINNSLILIADFGVPAALFAMYYAWAA